MPEVKTAAHDTVAVGIVFDQDPDPEAKVEEGETVTISVSSGPGTVRSPTSRARPSTRPRRP